MNVFIVEDQCVCVCGLYTGPEQQLPSEQLASSVRFGMKVLKSGEAVSRQNIVTLLSESVMARRVPMRQITRVAPCHQRVLQNSVPIFVL